MKYAARIGIAASLLIASSAAIAETDYEMQLRFCPGIDPGKGLSINKHLEDGSEADCVTEAFAVEVDFSRDWDDAIGQSLHYASQLEKRPGIILVCPAATSEAVCLHHKFRLISTVTYWRIGMMLWTCRSTDPALEDCLKEDLLGPN